MGEIAADAAVPDGPVDDSTVSFPELVWDHWQWERRLHTSGTVENEVTERFRHAFETFEKREGRLLNPYWSTTKASAVAVTVKDAWGPLRLFGREPTIRWHRASEWVIPKEATPVAESLNRSDTLAVQTLEVLTGASQRVAIQLILAVASHQLAFLDRCDGSPDADEAERVAKAAHRELDEIQAYYERAANKAARIVYSSGMLLGLLWIVLAGAVLVPVLYAFGLDPTSRVGQMLFASYALGGLGAVVSVMTRMASEGKGKFTLDGDLGRGTIRRLAAWRPALGAIFGVAAFAFVESGLLQLDFEDREFAVVASAAFVAGFSERWTKVVHAVEERFTGTPPGGQAPTEDVSIPDEAASIRKEERPATSE
jgi:hypothetical protein